MEKKLVPELRFPEFNYQWVTEELENIIEISKDKYNPVKENDIYKCIELENLSQKTGIVLGYFNSKEQNSIKNRFKKGEILFGKLRPYLKKYWNAEFDGVCSSEIWVLKGRKGFSNNYIHKLVQTYKFDYISNISSGSKMPRSDWNYMKMIPFLIPSIEEQTKIANFFTLIDKKLEKQEAKIINLEEYKKGMMQKIFSQEIRFKDEAGKDYCEWEDKKLGDISRVSMCRRIYENETSTDGDIPFYKIGSFGKTADSYITAYLFKEYKEKYAYPEEGSILISAAGTIGRIVEYDGKDAYYQDSNIVWLDVNKDFLLNKYLKFFYQTLKWDKLEGGTIKRLYNKDLIAISISLPVLQEQTKIANFLSSLDSKLKKEKEKLDSLKNLKKGLMQKMFI